MISKKIIEKLATKVQTSPENIAREYLQHLFLRYFYQDKLAQNVLFKGGTALRIIYQSPRFSEDLDFSAFKVSVSQIENLIEAALVKINREEKIELKEAKRTTGGYLAKFQATIGQIPVNGQLEISLRPKKTVTGQIFTISSQLIPPYTLCAYSEEGLVKEKITALLTRAKLRDFYDLYYILRAKLKINLTPRQIAQFAEKLEKTDDKTFIRQLKPFLPKSHHPVLRNFKQNLKRELERFS